MDKIKKISIIAIIVIVVIIIFSINALSQNTQRENELKDRRNDLTYQISQKDNQLEQLQIILEETTQDLEIIQKGDAYNLHDPTYKEVVLFIENERATQKPGTETLLDYKPLKNCIQISNRADTNGLRCVIVYVGMNEQGKYIIGFDTLDQDMIYYDPYSQDWVENLETGKEYYSGCLNQEYSINTYWDDSYSHYYDYEQFVKLYTMDVDWDDTISEIMYYW